jgi:hypothetical protein
VGAVGKGVVAAFEKGRWTFGASKTLPTLRIEEYYLHLVDTIRKSI